MSLGDKIIDARIARGWNRTELAAEVGCSLEMIRLIEVDKRSPSLVLLKAILDVLLVEYKDVSKNMIVLNDGIVKTNRNTRGRKAVLR